MDGRGKKNNGRGKKNNGRGKKNIHFGEGQKKSGEGQKKYIEGQKDIFPLLNILIILNIEKKIYLKNILNIKFFKFYN